MLNCDPVLHDRDYMADLCPRFIHLNLGTGQGRQKRCPDGAQHVFSQPADDGTVTALRICLHSQHHWYLKQQKYRSAEGEKASYPYHRVTRVNKKTPNAHTILQQSQSNAW